MHGDTHSGKNFRHWRGLKHLTCLRWGIFKGSTFSPCFCSLNVTQMCHLSVFLKLTKSSNKKGFCSDTSHLNVPPLPARASPLPQKTPDFCWLRLQHEHNSQTTGWRWTQPVQSSLRLSLFLTVRLTPDCLPWFSPPLPLTTESCLSSVWAAT